MTSRFKKINILANLKNAYLKIILSFIIEDYEIALANKIEFLDTFINNKILKKEKKIEISNL